MSSLKFTGSAGGTEAVSEACISFLFLLFTIPANSANGVTGLSGKGVLNGVTKRIPSFLLFFILYLLLYPEKGEDSMTTDCNSQNSHEKTRNPHTLTPETILRDFSFWLPRAREYGFRADELYVTSENCLVFAVPLPILRDGNFSLWLFHFATAELVTPRTVDFLVSGMSSMFDARLSRFVHFRHHYILAEKVTRKIPPRISSASIYVIKAEYSHKAYEIISKAILNFSRSFRSNLKFGDSLLNLCDELEVFSERLRKRADEIRSASSQVSCSDEVDPESHLAFLRRAEVVR